MSSRWRHLILQTKSLKNYAIITSNSIKGANNLGVTEVASGRFERMLPQFSLDKKAENRLQASMVKVMAGFVRPSLSLALTHIVSRC